MLFISAGFCLMCSFMQTTAQPSNAFHEATNHCFTSLAADLTLLDCFLRASDEHRAPSTLVYFFKNPLSEGWSTFFKGIPAPKNAAGRPSLIKSSVFTFDECSSIFALQWLGPVLVIGRRLRHFHMGTCHGTAHQHTSTPKARGEH